MNRSFLTALYLALSALSASSQQVPETCTASNFRVVVDGVSGSGSLMIAFAVPQVNHYLTSTGLYCTVTGNQPTCSSGNSVPLQAGQFITIATFNPSDETFSGARVYTSFTCK
jgi:hypothetical protein